MKYLLILAFLFAGCAKTNSHKNNNEPEVGLKAKNGFLVFNDLNLEQCIKNTPINYTKKREPIFADLNGDGKLSQSEALAIVKLNCSGQAIRNIRGIELLKNLNYLNCSGNQIGNLPNLSSLKILDTLRCTNNLLSDADCTEIAELKAKGLSLLEIESQKDGRKLTCDQVKLVGHVKHYIAPGTQFFNSNIVNDIWGFEHNSEEYLVYGSSLNIKIVKIFDQEPYFEKVSTISRGKDKKLWASANHSIWAEFRYYTDGKKAYLYASSEGNRKAMQAKKLPYLAIYDITDISKPKEVKIKKLHKGLQSIHNITLDSKNKWLIAFGGTDHSVKVKKGKRPPAWKGARFYSLENPEQPKYIGTVGDLYVHDGQIKTFKEKGKIKSYLYLAHGTTKIHWDANKQTNKENRIGIYDVTKLNAKSKIEPMINFQYPYGYAHNIWVTEDRKNFIVTGETSVDNQLSFWKINTNEEGVRSADFVSGLNFQGGSLAHNAFIRDDLIYLSHYSKGAQIAKIYTNSAGVKDIKLIWSYDTYPEHNSSKMDGSWGIYPFTKNNKIFASTDTNHGLFIFKKSENFGK